MLAIILRTVKLTFMLDNGQLIRRWKIDSWMLININEMIINNKGYKKIIIYLYPLSAIGISLLN